MSSFDAEALERAAKAARELESSKHVKAAVELSKREQNVKVREYDARKAEASADAEKAKAAQIQIAAEERRKTIAFERKAKEVSPISRAAPAPLSRRRTPHPPPPTHHMSAV